MCVFFFYLFLLIIWQILLAEISQPNLRGMLIGVPFVSYSCGILIVYGLGSLLDWRTVAWCGLLLPVFSFIAIILGPESPTWLARMGYYDKASKGKFIHKKNRKYINLVVIIISNSSFFTISLSLFFFYHKK